jgi:hypothetical protein
MKRLTLLFLILALSACNSALPASIAPSAAEPPPVPRAPVPAPRFGVTALGVPFDCGILQSIGAQAGWDTLFWANIEPSQDEWQFEKMDAAIAAAEECGIAVSLKLRAEQGHWGVLPVEDPADAEYNDGHKRGSRPPVNLDDYYDWVYTVASRYRGRVRAYAVENEVNAKVFWLGTYDEYESMLETAQRAVKAADPDALVADSGIASAAYGISIARWRYEHGDTPGAIEWLNRFYSRRTDQKAENEEDLRLTIYSKDYRDRYVTMLRHFQRPDLYDIYQLHFYESWDLLPELLEWIRARMAESGALKPIEAWEIGYVEENAARYDEAKHGRDTAKLLATALGEGVTGVYYLPYLSSRAREGLPEKWWGLVEADSTSRPARDAYAQIAAALSQFDSAVRLRAGPDEWAYQFDGLILRWTRDGEVRFE